MSEEKLLYKLFIDDQASETFEEFLSKRVIRAEQEITHLVDALELAKQRLKKTQFIKRHNVIDILADCGAYEAAMQSLQQQGNEEAYKLLLTYKEEVLDNRGNDEAFLD